jgi:hypothetical protein
VACPFCSKHFAIPAEGIKPVSRRPAAAEAPSYATTIRFTFSCQRCQSILEGNSQLSGQIGRCPSCGAVFTVPQVDRKTGLPLGPAHVEDDGQLPTPVHAYATAGDKAPKIVRLGDDRQVIVCPRCAGHMPIDSNLCKSCGIPFTMEGAAAVMETASPTNPYASASLIVGILSVPTFMCVGVPALVAIVLGTIGLTRMSKDDPAKRGRMAAIIGIVCGAVSLGLYAVVELL